MKPTIIAFAAICLAAAPAFAAQQAQDQGRTWSGFLVDRQCYESEERNVNPGDTETYVDRDRDLEVRFCSPHAKTKTFSLVDHDGIGYSLNAAGNAKAAEIARQTGKKVPMEVTVEGQQSKNTIDVGSISLAK